MIELTKYFSVFELEMAWMMSETATFVQTEDGPQIVTSGFAKVLAQGIPPGGGRNIALSAAKTLGDFMKQGPVIVRPSLTLCRALIDTELNFPITDYRQPFKRVGVEIPTEISGMQFPVLAMVSLIEPTWLTVWIRHWATLVTYHVHVGPNLPTIEDQVRQLEWADTKEEERFFHNTCRIAINTCLLAANRQTQVAPLPDNVVKKRRRQGDVRVQQLAARQCQEIVFRDLVIYDRTQDKQESVPTGLVHGKQHRRGHWKRVAFGPRHSMHRLQWLNDYWTHREIEGEKPEIVMQ